MVAPSGAGKNGKKKFIDGSGIPNLTAVHQNYTKDAFDIALSYSKYIGRNKSWFFCVNL